MSYDYDPAGPDLTIGVLIASYGRAADLVRCLNSLTRQTLPPSEVIAVIRDTDTASRTALGALPTALFPLTTVVVTEPGLIHARNAGFRVCRSDVLAMTDDDAIPDPAWLERLLRHYLADPAVGAVGGRDRCHDGVAFDDRQAAIVGKVQWFGRLIGNNHLGFGEAREVHHLKGANMSVRSKLLEQRGCDTRLRGSGAQPFEDIALTLGVRHRGWKVIYDPAALVEHYASQREEARFYVDLADVTDATGFKNFAFNEVVALWESLSWSRRTVYVVWSMLVGTGACPGLVQALRFTPRLGAASWRRFGIAQRGKMAAFRQMLFGPADSAASQREAALSMGEPR